MIAFSTRSSLRSRRRRTRPYPPGSRCSHRAAIARRRSRHDEPGPRVDRMMLDAHDLAGADRLVRRQQPDLDRADLLEVDVDIRVEQVVARRLDAQLVLAEGLLRRSRRGSAAGSCRSACRRAGPRHRRCRSGSGSRRGAGRARAARYAATRTPSISSSGLPRSGSVWIFCDLLPVATSTTLMLST